jgi:hypothetical protein
MRSIVTVSLALSLAACSSSYHPEYHPVTVTNVSQNLAYPTPTSANGDRVPIYVVPSAPAPVVMLPEAAPPDFFR